MTEREFYLNGIKRMLDNCAEVGLLGYIWRLLCNSKKYQEEEDEIL